MALKGKKYLWKSFILTFLAIMFMVNVPVKALPTVTYSIDPNVTTGVSAGSPVMVNVTIDTPVNITGFRIWVKIDPAVLSLGYYVAFPGMWFYVTPGTFLSDWADDYGWTPGIVPIAYTVETDGYDDISMFIKTWEALPAGHGANGTGTLVTLWFTSLSETAYSRINITQAQYTTRDAANPIDVDVLNDGHYNQLGSLSGTVTDASTGFQIANANISYVSGPTAFSPATTAGDGTYTITELALGDYNVTASKAGYEDQTKSITIVGGANTLDFALTPIVAKGSLNGTVTDASTEDPIAGATIEAVGPETKSTTTETDGTYLLADLPTGSYTVTASKDGYDSDSKPATVTESETTTIDFTLTQKVHDLNVTNVVPSTFVVLVGESVEINVTVENEGDFEESFNLTLYAGVDPVETKAALNLAAGANQTYAFNWTTTAIGNFTIKAEVPQVPGEVDTTDNTWTTTLWSIQVIPEFPTFMLLPLLMIATIVAAIISKKVWSTRRRGHTYQIKTEHYPTHLKSKPS